MLSILSSDEIRKQKLLPNTRTTMRCSFGMYIFLCIPIPSFFGMEGQAMKEEVLPPMEKDF